MISIIIPYKDNPERGPLLDAVTKRIRDLWPIAEGLEIVISAQENDEAFHRALMLNKGARMSRGGLLIFMDGDLILPVGYFSMIDYDCPSVGWRRLHMAGPATTSLYLAGIVGTDALRASATAVRDPNIDGNAGGITIIRREIFFNLKGFPEDFNGFWGGEDNAFWHKLRTFGHGFRTADVDVIHLHHFLRAPRKHVIHAKHHQMAEWTREKWQKRLDKTGDNWGK